MAFTEIWCGFSERGESRANERYEYDGTAEFSMVRSIDRLVETEY